MSGADRRDGLHAASDNLVASRRLGRTRGQEQDDRGFCGHGFKRRENVGHAYIMMLADMDLHFAHGLCRRQDPADRARSCELRASAHDGDNDLHGSGDFPTSCGRHRGFLDDHAIAFHDRRAA